MKKKKANSKWYDTTNFLEACDALGSAYTVLWQLGRPFPKGKAPQAEVEKSAFFQYLALATLFLVEVQKEKPKDRPLTREEMLLSCQIGLLRKRDCLK